MLSPAKESARWVAEDEGFRPPRFDAPLDVSAFLARVPDGAVGKGMFLRRLFSELASRGHPQPTDETFQPFQDVPLSRCLELNVTAAQILYPGLPTPEALRRLAWLSFETFQDSLAGQLTLFSTQHNPHAIFSLTSTVVRLTTNVGSYRHRYIDSRSCMISARDTYFFAECFGVGMAEGVLRFCGRPGSVWVRTFSQADVDYLIRWT